MASKKTSRGMGGVYRQKGSQFWYIHYTPPGGEQIRESSKSSNYTDALKLLKQRQGEAALGRPVGPQFDRAVFAEIAELVLNQYRQNKQKSIDRVEQAFRLHLLPFFKDGREKIRNITFARIERYKEERLKEKPQTRGGDTTKNATVNYELRMLKRALHMGVDASLVALPLPKIVLLEEDNARKGFVKREQIQAICDQLPAHLVPLVRAHYITGWRVKSELQTRTWEHVDFKGGWLRLDPGEGKSGEPRLYPLTPELRHLLIEQAERKLRLGLSTPWVFFYDDGSQIKHYRRAWSTAVKAVGLDSLIPHDFRRSAVFNLADAGVDRKVAMDMVGHKTESMYRRYFPQDLEMLKKAGEKLSQYLATQEGWK